MDTRKVIDRILGGESEAFAALVELYERPLYACALARVYDREDARDLCQDAFLRAYLSLRSLRNRDAFGPWLFMIMRRLCVDFLRGKWRRIEGEKQMSPSEEAMSTDLRRELCRHDSAEALWRLVGQLDENSREVLALYYGQQMKTGEIAALTGVGESAVKMRLQKARMRLGQRAEELQGVWGPVVTPSLLAGTMEWVKMSAPMKAAPLALSPLAAVLGGFGGALVWMQQKDLERWRQHVPAGMAGELKQKTHWGLVRTLAVIGLICLFPVLKARIPQFDAAMVIIWLVFFSAVCKREMALMRPSEIARFCVFLALELLLIAVMVKVPGRGVAYACLSGIALLCGLFTSANQAGAASIPPGAWLMPMLAAKQEKQTTSGTLSWKEIKRWLTLLYELGLVSAPVKRDANGIAVRLRLRTRFGLKNGWGFSYSSIRVDRSSTITCEITPQDYIALARQFGPVELPPRRELAEALGQRFAAALACYVDGGKKSEIAECLGLSECPIDGRRSYLFRFTHYALIVLGGIGIIAGLSM